MYLSHYGVKGMKWGERNEDEPENEQSLLKKNSRARAFGNLDRALTRRVRKTSKNKKSLVSRNKNQAEQLNKKTINALTELDSYIEEINVKIDKAYEKGASDSKIAQYEKKIASAYKTGSNYMKRAERKIKKLGGEVSQRLQNIGSAYIEAALNLYEYF